MYSIHFTHLETCMHVSSSKVAYPSRGREGILIEEIHFSNSSRPSMAYPVQNPHLCHLFHKFILVIILNYISTYVGLYGVSSFYDFNGSSPVITSTSCPNVTSLAECYLSTAMSCPNNSSVVFQLQCTRGQFDSVMLVIMAVFFFSPLILIITNVNYSITAHTCVPGTCNMSQSKFG